MARHRARTVAARSRLQQRECEACDRVSGTSQARRERSGNQLAHLLLETAEDARFGLADGGGRHSQHVDQCARQAAFDRGQPERLPGPFLKLAAHLFDGAAVELTDLGLLVGIFGSERVGHGLEALPGVRSSDSLGPTVIATDVQQYLAVRDRAQPAAERVARAVMVESFQVGGGRDEHPLGDVLGVGGIEPGTGARQNRTSGR